MRKITLLFLILLPFCSGAQSFTTPGTGTNYSLDDIMALSPSTISFDGTNYILSEALEIAASDTLTLDTPLSLLIDSEIEIDVHGTFISNAGDEEEDEIFITATNEENPWGGFWFYSGSEVIINNTNIQYGGGLKTVTEDFTLTNSYLAYNVSGTSTGAVVSLSNGSPLIEGNTFYMNDMPAVASGATNSVSAHIFNNYIEANNQSNQNRPQINMGPTGADTLRIVQNTIIGDPAMIQAGGIGVSNLTGSGEIRVIIDANIVSNNRYGITIAGGNAFAYIRNNVIEDNNTQGIPMDGGSGISLNSGSNTQEVIASNNQIRGNLWGITVINQASINLGDDADNPGGNVFSDNGNGGEIFALYNNTPNTIMAMHNCWIEDEEATLENAEAVIFHENDNASLGEVIFDPVNCESLSVGDIAMENFTFYPNPAKEAISFDNNAGFQNLKIYSITGKLVTETLLQQDFNRIPLELSSGIYFLQFSNAKNSISKKLIVE